MGARGTSRTSIVLIHDTGVRRVRFKGGLGTVTHTKTKIGGVPLSGYTRRKVIMFGAPKTGTGNMGRLIVTKVLLTTESIINKVR